MALLYTTSGEVKSLHPRNKNLGFTLEELQSHVGQHIDYVRASDSVYFLLNAMLQQTATNFNKFITRTLYVQYSDNRAYYGNILAIELNEIAQSLKEEAK